MNARPAAPRAAIAALVIASSLPGACDRQSPPAPPAPAPGGGGPTHAATSEPKPAGEVHTYTVRGVVEDLPDPAKPMSSFTVHHEAIDDFVRKDGSKGMGAMTMPFTLAPGVSTQGIAVGDKVELVWTVQWEPRAVTQVTSITKLPADTELRFGPAK